MNEILQGDCAEVLKTLESESVDLTVTSPPYDNLRDYNGFVFDFESIAKELYRVTKRGGVLVWVVGDSVVNGSETGTSFKQALFFKELGFNLHDTMIYEKNGTPFPDINRYYQCFEYMFILSKGKPKTTNLLKDRKNRWERSFGKVSNRQKDGTLKVIGLKTFEPFGVRFNIWRINCGFGRSTKDLFAHEHPAIFPDDLAQDHILTWSNEGDTVLDPMCGSGTVLKMAKRNKRNYIGIELSQKYIEIAERRIETECGTLF
jgi:DNA modification methylase